LLNHIPLVTYFDFPFQGHHESITAIEFGPNDTTVASSSLSGDILLHSLTTGALATRLAAHQHRPETVHSAQSNAIRDIAYSPHHKSLLASVGDDGYIDIWDTLANKLQVSFTQKQSSSFGTNQSQAIHAVKFSSTSPSLLATAGMDRKLSFYDILSNK
jgi:protein NEDD1